MNNRIMIEDFGKIRHVELELEMERGYLLKGE